MKQFGISFLMTICITGALSAGTYPGFGDLICIDPGHGGSDPGAVGVNNLVEKNINLQISRKLDKFLFRDTVHLPGGGIWRVIHTRDSDVYVSLSNRVSYANNMGAEYFVSIHANASSNPAANGTESYCYAQGSTASFDLRDLMQEEMIAAWGLTDRGCKTASFYVLVNTSMPAVLLETGFVTSAIDAVKLGNQTARIVMGRHLLYGLQRRVIGYSQKPNREVRTQIYPNTSIFNISDIEINNTKHFYLFIPTALISHIEFETYGGYGDVDLFVRFLGPACPWGGNPCDSYDWYSVNMGNDEKIELNGSLLGDYWYIGLVTTLPYSGVTLRVRHW
jgi:N-acetylmuramoyl-L-alanine amidase